MEMARKKTMATFTISPEVIERLEQWLKTLEFSPGKSAIVEKAVVEYLDRREKSDKKR